MDTFTFADVSDGVLKMEYTNRFARDMYDSTYPKKKGQPLYGWQAITIRGFSFTANC